jgi:hypothetical protein
MSASEYKVITVKNADEATVVLNREAAAGYVFAGISSHSITAPLPITGSDPDDPNERINALASSVSTNRPMVGRINLVLEKRNP